MKYIKLFEDTDIGSTTDCISLIFRLPNSTEYQRSRLIKSYSIS